MNNMTNSNNNSNNNNTNNSTSPVKTESGENVEVQGEPGQLHPECGFVTDRRIFGGTDANAHEFPWAVALVYSGETDEELSDSDPQMGGSAMFLCGGALISPAHVLTAAHCISSRGVRHLRRVRMGHADLTHEDTFEADIEAVTIHPDFMPTPYLVNDLAILRLTR